LEAMPLVADHQFSVLTARMIIARRQDDKPAFIVALDAWLDANGTAN
jgi:hypothetical protein